MKKSTQDLLEILKHSPLHEYLEKEQENLTTETLPEALARLMALHNLKKVDIIQRSGFDRSYAYQIFSGEKEPSRNKLLALCFGMQLSAEETQSLLKITGYAPLYPRIEADAIVLYALEHHLGLTDTNEYLYDLGWPLVE